MTGRHNGTCRTRAVLCGITDHDYVFCVIGEMSQPGYSLSNVVDARLKLLHKNAGDEDTPGKIALLEVLELAYKCTYGP